MAQSQAADPRPKASEKFHVGHIPSLLVETFKSWNADDPWRLSAVVAYYAILALPGLLVIVINVVGYIWGVEIVQGKLHTEFAQVLGSEGAKAIEGIFASARIGDKNVFATITGIATLIFGATGVFYQLQLSLNEVWGIKQDPHAGIAKVLLDRALGFGFILVIGFLLLVSFVVSAFIALLNTFIIDRFPDVLIYAAYALNVLLTLGVISFLFALLFKYLPDARISWRSVWVGAVITAVLFSLGKLLLELYFGFANPGSTYGAAGSLILVLLWVSYSCLILFFGAEFTWVYARRYSRGIIPSSHAMLVEERQVVLKRGSEQPTSEEH